MQLRATIFSILRDRIRPTWWHRNAVVGFRISEEQRRIERCDNFIEGGHSVNIYTGFGGFIIVSFPVVILFMVMQKYLVSGLTAGGVKG